MVLKFFLSRRTLKEFLSLRRTGVNVNFLKQNIVFEVWRMVTERFFVTTTTPLLFLDFTDFTGYHTMVFYFTVVAGDTVI